MTVNSVSSGLSAIHRQSAAMDRAAEKIARATTGTPVEAATSPEAASAVQDQESQLADGTVEMMVARRMFTAAVKTAQVANEGVMEALRLGGYGAAA
ncbi:MAG: hypothetical protein ACT4P7_01265 [Gemmatimonadaceae bacterium]